MKIAYVLDDLDAAGGIQAVTRAKAAALAAGLRRICRRASGW